MSAVKPTKPVNSHAKSQAATAVNTPDSFEAKQLFITSAIAMSWQMAIGVLVPVVGGYYLGEYLKLNPWITFAGLLVAVLAVVLIVRQSIRSLPEYAKKERS